MAHKKSKHALSEMKEMRSKRAKGHYAPSHGFVTGHDPKVGRNDHANMPPEVMMKNYPKARTMDGSYLDDTMSDIDAVMGNSESDIKRHLSHQK